VKRGLLLAVVEFTLHGKVFCAPHGNQL